MRLLTGSGARIYGISTILAVVTGLMEFAPWVTASMLAAANHLPVTYIIWLVSGIWLICGIAAVVLFRSHSTLSPIIAIAGAAIVIFDTGWGLVLLAKSQKLYDPLYFTAPIPEWAWMVIPFVFNIVLAALATIRYQQIRSEVTPCPQ